MAELRSCDAGSTPIGGSQLAAPASGGGGGSSNSSNANTQFNHISETPHKNESCQNNTATSSTGGNGVIAGGKISSGRRNSDTVTLTRTTNNSASAALSIPSRFRGHSGGTTRNCDSKVSVGSTSPSAVSVTAKSSRDGFLSTVASTSHLPPRKRKYTALEFSAIDLSVQTKAQTESPPPASTSSVVSPFSTVPFPSPKQEEIISSPVTRKQAAIAAAAAAAASSSGELTSSPASSKYSSKHARLSLPSNNLVTSSTSSGDLDSLVTPTKGGRSLRATPSRRSLAATPQTPYRSDSVNGVKVSTRRQSLRSPRTSLSLASSPSVSPGRRLTRQSSQSNLLPTGEHQALAVALHVGTKRRRIASGKSTSSVDSSCESPSAAKRARRGSSCTSTSSSASQQQVACSSAASSIRASANPLELRTATDISATATGVTSSASQNSSSAATATAAAAAINSAAPISASLAVSQGTTSQSSSLQSKSRRLKATAESTLSSQFALASPSNSITPSSSLSSTSSFNISSSPNTNSSASATAAAAFFGGGSALVPSGVYSLSNIVDFPPPNSSVVVVTGGTSSNTVAGLNPSSSGSLFELSSALPLPQGSSSCFRHLTTLIKIA